MRNKFAALALAVLLIGCGQQTETTSPGSTDGYFAADQEEAARGGATGQAAPEAAPAPPPAPASEVDARQAGERQPIEPPGPGPQQGGTTSPILYLAYAYQIGLELPAANVSAVVERHATACQQAGPRVCQLIGSNVSGDPESAMNGYVSMRGEPNWLRSFMSGLEAEAEQAGGRILQETTNSEDLTRAIVDTEARLRAQTALRDRLQRLLESRPGRLSDLLEVERELARVQAEIDSVQSNLAVMRTRVSMSELTLNYQSAPRPLRSDTFRPLGEALANFLGFVVAGFAAIITVIAVLLPWALVIGLIVWAALRWRKRRGGRFFNRAPKTPPEPPATPT
jgi:hypothetical protein